MGRPDEPSNVVLLPEKPQAPAACPLDGSAVCCQAPVRKVSAGLVSANIVRDEVSKLEWQRGVSPAPIDVQGGARHAYCRSLELDGQVGWHLPSTVELVSLLDYSKAAPHLDTTVFTGTPTGDANAGLGGGEYSVTSPRVNYDNGLVETESITGGSYYVRCVRSTVAPPTGQRFSVSNGEVTDAYTKLVWQQAQSTMTSPTKAPEKCASPWRLPTAKELYTILDPTQTTPYFDHTVFNGNNDWHFTSTLAPADLSKRIVIDFSKPQGVFLTGTFDGWVRCVK